MSCETWPILVIMVTALCGVTAIIVTAQIIEHRKWKLRLMAGDKSCLDPW